MPLRHRRVILVGVALVAVLLLVALATDDPRHVLTLVLRRLVYSLF